jgi:hypothetical protein
MRPGLAAAVAIIGILFASAIRDGGAQELEPRIYSPNPVGAHFLGLAYARSTGGVLTDPTLPITDIDARLDSAVAGYGYTFAAFDRSAIATFALPYVDGSISGNVGEDRRSVTRSGIADARLRLGLNLIGGSAMTLEEFRQRSPKVSLGMSLTVVAPTGQYDPAKLINLGSNRWAFKPELGVSWPKGPWYLEAYGGAWFFTPNDEFYSGSRRREQDPLATAQTHIVYTLRPRLWVAFDAILYHGGRTTVDGVRNADRQSNVRLGLTVALPATARHSLKLSWSDGVSTRAGSDFTNLGIAWQYMWLD